MARHQEYRFEDFASCSETSRISWLFCLAGGLTWIKAEIFSCLMMISSIPAWISFSSAGVIWKCSNPLSAFFRFLVVLFSQMNKAHFQTLFQASFCQQAGFIRSVIRDQNRLPFGISNSKNRLGAVPSPEPESVHPVFGQLRAFTAGAAIGAVSTAGADSPPLNFAMICSSVRKIARSSASIVGSCGNCS